jgi:hypothetical protein
MALTEGLVQRIIATRAVTCVIVGPSVSNGEYLFVQLRAADAEPVLGFKRNVVDLLARAQAGGWPVRIGHPDDGAEIQSATLRGFNISVVGHAVHDDAFSISGSGIPPGTRVEFDAPLVNILVTPNLVRPHWVLVDRLSTLIPVGRLRVRLTAPGFNSDWVPLEVRAGPPAPVRVLYTGEPKDRPYTIVFVANPAIQTEGGAFIADPVLADRLTFRDVVGFAIRNLLTVTEDLLRRGDRDREIRFVSIFDSTQGPGDANALAHELAPNLMETRRDRLNGFLNRYAEVADVVFVMHGSTTHNRATAWYTTDDPSRPSTGYSYDGVARLHGHFPRIPGSTAIPLDTNRVGLTPLHEFGHAGSDFDNGRVRDLYNDNVGGFAVNKRSRAVAGGPIPANFATYDGTNFTSDQNRDSLGYPNNWMSYHPVLIDAGNPNMMDDYNQAPGGNRQVCRLDQLTSEWFIDRIRAKLGR